MSIIDLSLELYFSEPGYYEDGNFGIRIENVLIVNEADTKYNFGDKGYLSFEHITWVSLKISVLVYISLFLQDFYISIL